MANGVLKHYQLFFCPVLMQKIGQARKNNGSMLRKGCHKAGEYEGENTIVLNAGQTLNVTIA